MGTFETIDAGGAMPRVYRAGDLVPGARGVVVLHPWWGLNDDVVAYADRLAGSGFAVLAPDLFGGQVASTIEEADRLAGAADEAAIDAITLAAVDDLADRLGPTAKLAALGFSFGAHWAMWTPAERDRLAASVVYYGTSGGPFLGRARVPVLGHFAQSDPYETDEVSPSSRRRSGRRVATSSSTATRGPATGSPSRRATPTAPPPPIWPSSAPSRSLAASSGCRRADDSVTGSRSPHLRARNRGLTSVLRRVHYLKVI